MSSSVIVWFRRDLRLYDNPALCSAVEDGDRVVPVYIFAPEEDEPWPPGAASRWWLHHSLAALDSELRRLKSRLLVFRGDSLSVLMMLCRKSGHAAVYWNRLYEPAAHARDTRVAKALETIGIATRSFPGHLLREPGEVMSGAGTPYRIFTPYSRASLRLGPPSPALGSIRPDRLAMPDDRDDGLESLQLGTNISGQAELARHWRPGENEAWRRTISFIESHAADYGEARDRPGIEGTSRLSPHLHFGEISPRSLWHAVTGQLAIDGRDDSGLAYLRQLLWRDFAHQLLFHFPHISESAFKPAFNELPWRDDPGIVAAWQSGTTGIPLIDAGMRELRSTGFMHNRARMNAASFLTKNAGIHWLVGARWFWDTLVDADLANNTLGWQWVAGSGPDAAPYFRIFNPVTQGQRFDPRGVYVRRWIPALNGLPDKWIHSPWTADEETLARAGVRLEEDYPEPVLDLKESRRRALAAYGHYVAGR